MCFTSTIDRAFLLLALVSATALSRPADAQTSLTTEQLAADTSDAAAKAKVQRILTASLQGCLLDTELCTTLDAELHRDLKNVTPSTEWIGTEKIASVLERHGLLPIDKYNGLALRVIAPDTGAELLITEDLRLNIHNNFELVTQIYDSAHDKELGDFKVGFPVRFWQGDGRPMVFNDPESGASLVIDRGNPHYTEFIECLWCPMPVYLPERRDTGIRGAVDLLVTVTEQGRADQAVVVKTFDEGITSELLEVVQGWRFRPATDRDGKSFAVRTHIQAQVTVYPAR